jgi:geranylgeranyl pyrophosphate synthase
MDALNCWFEVPRKSFGIITDIVNLLHTSSLMLDDIEDQSPLRRGKPATHTIYGQGQTINSANHMYAMAFKEVRKLTNSNCLDIFSGMKSSDIFQGIAGFFCVDDC